MANIVTNDVRTYVKELVSKEFNPAAKNGHKIETDGESEGRYPDRLLTVHPQTASFSPERRFRSFEILDIAHTMPAVSKSLKPCSEPKSTICGRTLTHPETYNQSEDLYHE
jgi:hypothetical protein